MAFSPDRSLLFAFYSRKKNPFERLKEGDLKMWDLRKVNSRPAWQWHCVGYTANQMDISPDGKILAVACTDGQTRLWRWPDGKFYRAISAVQNSGISGTTSLSFSLDGKSLIISSVTTKIIATEPYNMQSIIRFLDANEWKLQRYFVVKGAIRLMRLSPDERRLAVAGGIGVTNQVFGQQAVGYGAYIAVLEPTSGQKLSNEEVFPDEPADGVLAFAPDGNTLLVGWRGTALLFTLSKLPKLLSPVSLNLQPQPSYGTVPVSLSADGKWVAGAPNGAPNNEAVRVYEAQTGMQIRTFPASEAIAYITFTPDNETLIGVGEKGAVFRWRLV